MKQSYSEKLKHPLWQKKRLEVLELYGFSCAYCGSEDKTLHVHHKIYEKGRDPWDYPSSSLVSLCVDCHESRHSLVNEINSIIGSMDPGEIKRLLGYARATFVIGNVCLDRSLAIRVENYQEALGVSDAYRVDTDELVLHFMGQEDTPHEITCGELTDLQKNPTLSHTEK